jgi:toxin ParE1/3/4
LKQTLQLLAEQPLLGQLRDDLRPNLRAFSARRYVILYYPREFGIEVVTILHGARDIEGMFERGER